MYNLTYTQANTTKINFTTTIDKNRTPDIIRQERKIPLRYV